MKLHKTLSWLGVVAAATVTLGAAAPGAMACGHHHRQHLAPSHGDRGSVDTVVATFTNIAPEHRQEFLTAAQKEAYLSLKLEKGTLSYHIVPDPTDSTRVFFEATFADAAAYATHRADFPAVDFLKIVAKDNIVGPGIVFDNTSMPNTDGKHVQPSRGDRGSVDTVVATFTNIAPEHRQEFLTAAQKEAYLSLKLEKGTLSYHIVPDPNDSTRVFFEATFADAAAYATHRADFPAVDFLKIVAKDNIVGPGIVFDNTSVPNVLS